MSKYSRFRTWLDNFSWMEKQVRSTPLITIITCCLLLIPLAYAAFFAACKTPFDQWTIWFPKHSEDQAATGGQDSLKLLVARLVRGYDRNKLEGTGFGCDYAPHSVVCVANNQVRIETSNLKVYIHSNNQTETVVQPYGRQEYKDLMSSITPVRILQENITETPKSCDYAHKVPVIVFSTGLIGNLFHEVSEIIIPLFLTSRHFQSSVQFIVTDYQPWFVQKYNHILTQLSSYQVIGITSNTGVHCFPGAVVGLKYHDHLDLNPNSIPGGYTMLDFKRFLRETYSLKFKNADEIKKPVLLLVSRETSRTFVNENEMVQMMEDMGFQVTIRDTKDMFNLDEFSEVVNSCNVMVGAHGAGLTNMIFLPQGAVLIQIVPYALTWASNTYFGQPAPKMGLKYLEYKTVAEESSLISSYGPNDPVITNPESLYSKGYQAVRAIYVDGQNITINLSNFRPTLVEALVHLGHPYPPK